MLTMFALALTIGLCAQTSLRGTVVDDGTGNAIVGAVVTLGNQSLSTTTNQSGEFSLVYLEAGDEEVIVEADGYNGTIELVLLVDGQANQMDPIRLQPDMAREAQEEVLLNLAESELNDDEGKSQAQASASSASTDVFNNITSFAWSTARYRNRGYEQRYESSYINGLNFNSAERGQFNFSAMGGLNDASRNKEVVNALEANNFTFGNLGNNTNYLMQASRFAQGWKIGVAGTNRNYKAAVRATYASGPLANGWSFVGQVALRFSPYTQAKNQIGEGIDYWSGGYFFAAEKVFSNKSRLNLVTFGAPTQRGQSAAVTQEVYDLTGSIYYNPYWGYQNGKMRNSRIVKSFDPTVIASYEITLANNHHLKVAAGYHYSMYSNSAINFYNAPDPRPDYYRNLPSYMWDGQIAPPTSNQLYHLTGDGADGAHFPWGNFIGADMNGNPLGTGFTGADGNIIGPSIDPKSYNELVELWKSRDNTTTQIGWDALYAANYANNHVNPNGSSRYIQERRHNDIQEAAASFNYAYTGKEHLKLTLGFEGKYSQGVHYKTADDLLGGKQWIDVDPFADRDIKELASNVGLTQEEINMVKKNNMAFDYNDTINTVGQRFGYDYRINMSNEKVWLQNEWSFNEVDFYYGVQLTYSMMQRSTRMVNGRAWYLAQQRDAEGFTHADLYFGPDAQKILNLYGDSKLRTQTWNGYSHHFLDPAVKLGATYKINGRNRIKVNAMAQTAAPLARDAYISARVHDRVIESIYRHDNAKNLKDYFAASEKNVGVDLTYEFNYPVVRGRITGFYTQFWDGTELNGYYNDEANTFVNQVLTGVNKRHMGIEAAAAFKLGTYFTLTPALSVGNYKYTSNAYSVTSAENGMELGKSSLDGKPYFETRDSVLLKGLRISNGPQVNTSLKLSFFHPKMWFADITVSYYDWNWLNVSPNRRMKGLFTGMRTDGSVVDAWYGENVMGYASESEAFYPIKTTDGKAPDLAEGNAYPTNAELDKNGVPVLQYPYNIMSQQESLVATNPLNRFIIDASVGKLIYLKNRQSLSLNLSISNLTNNTHFKTGGYQQARLPMQTKQGEKDENQNSIISPNAWKFPSKYYYAWGANFYFTVTYKF